MRIGSAVLSLIIAIVAVSCGGPERPEVDALAVRVVWDEGWTLFDAHGHEVRIVGEGSATGPVVNGVFAATDRQGMVSVCRGLAHPRAIEGLTGLRGAGLMAEGLIPVVGTDGCLIVADVFGRHRFKLESIGGCPIIRSSGMYRCGVLSVCDVNGRWGAVDSNGNLVVPMRYASELVFDRGVAVGCIAQDGNGADREYDYEFVTTSGEVSYKFPTGMFADDPVIRCGKVAVCANGLWGLLNSDGDFKPLGKEVHGVGMYDDTYIIYVDAAGHRGLMDADGRVLLRARYNTLEIAHRGLLLASNAQSYFVINRDGTEVLRFDDADEVVCLGGGGSEFNFGSIGYAVRSGGLWWISDCNGQRIGNYESVAVDVGFIDGVAELEVGPVAAHYIDGAMERFTPDSVGDVPDSLVIVP